MKLLLCRSFDIKKFILHKLRCYIHYNFVKVIILQFVMGGGEHTYGSQVASVTF